MLYLVLDIETTIDRSLLHYDKGLVGETPDDTLARYEQELKEKSGNGFIPAKYHRPMAFVILALESDGKTLRPVRHAAIADLNAKDVSREFWSKLEMARARGGTTVVTFNGRSFDMPVMERQAIRCGIPAPNWFVQDVPSYQNPRAKFASDLHLDLMDDLSGSGQFSRASLSYWCRQIDGPGKPTDVDGSKVEQMVKDGKKGDVLAYCATDVVNTAFLLFRRLVVGGRASIAFEQQFRDDTLEYFSAMPGVSESAVWSEFVNLANGELF